MDYTKTRPFEIFKCRGKIHIRESSFWTTLFSVIEILNLVRFQDLKTRDFRVKSEGCLKYAKDNISTHG